MTDTKKRDVAPGAPAAKQPALRDETYPAGMENQRKEPALGEEKSGPRNPEPLPE